MTAYTHIQVLIEEYFPHLTANDYSATFGEIGIDSFDLVEFRVAIQHAAQLNIPDADWVQFDCLQSIVSYCAAQSIAGDKNK